MNPHIAVISSGRPHRVEATNKWLGPLAGEARWYVGDEDEMHDYAYVGADATPSGSQPEARNAALNYAFADGRPCVILADDLTGAPSWWSADTKILHKITIPRALQLINEHTSDVDTPLRGCSPHDSTRFMPKAPVSERAFIVADIMIVHPTDLRFDTNMPLYSDLDFSLQVLSAHSRVARYNPVLPNFTHRENLGGAQNYRSDILEREMVDYMLRKWPGAIIHNVQRPNTVLLRQGWPA